MEKLALTRRGLIGGAAGLIGGPAFSASAPRAPDLTFLVLGDWGRRGGRRRAGSKIQQTVAGAMAAEAKRTCAKFVVTVGDNFYHFGVQSTCDSHWRESFLDVYDLKALPLWYPALGNHDNNGDPDAQVAYSKINPRWCMPARYYRQTVGLPAGRSLDLFVLDTSPIADKRKYPRPASEIRAQWDWFDREASASRADWKLVFGHHPLLSSGAKKRHYEYLADWLPKRLEAYGIQAYVAGHDHHLEYIETEQFTQIISGGGSKGDRMTKTRETWHKVGWEQPGFTAFDISGDELTVRFISANGAELGEAHIPRSRARSANQSLPALGLA